MDNIHPIRIMFGPVSFNALLDGALWTQCVVLSIKPEHLTNASAHVRVGATHELNVWAHPSDSFSEFVPHSLKARTDCIEAQQMSVLEDVKVLFSNFDLAGAIPVGHRILRTGRQERASEFAARDG